MRRYGSEIFTSPWLGHALLDDKVTLRSGEIWVTWVHAVEFPTVLEKLDASGKLLGQFWNAGYISVVVPVVRDGHRLVLLGGTNNDANSAMLAVVDADRPSGTSAALQANYDCADCPPGHPSRYLLFPRLDSDDVLTHRPYVFRVEPDAEGQTIVAVQHGVPTPAAVYYRFDRDFNLLRTEWSPEYRLFRRELQEQHRLPVLRRGEDPFRPRISAPGAAPASSPCRRHRTDRDGVRRS